MSKSLKRELGQVRMDFPRTTSGSAIGILKPDWISNAGEYEEKNGAK